MVERKNQSGVDGIDGQMQAISNLKSFREKRESQEMALLSKIIKNDPAKYHSIKLDNILKSQWMEVKNGYKLNSSIDSERKN
jgi:hypothetical protein